MGPWPRSHGRRWNHKQETPRPWASMRPWLCSHGRPTRWRSGCRIGRSFNGAVALQPRKGSSIVRAIAAVRSFNGAVALQPRKDLTGRVNRLSSVALQWGRGFAATEGGVCRRIKITPRCFNGAVALQPRKGVSAFSSAFNSTSFNGAVALQPRKGGR